MGTRKGDKHQLLTRTYTNQTTSWLVHSLNTFGARMSHRQIQIHKTHHGPDLGEATTFSLIVYYVPLHEAHIQMAFCLKTPKSESRNSQSWDSYNFGAPNFVCKPPIEMRSEAKLYPHWDLSNGMLHITCMQGNRVDSRLLVVGSQTTNSIPDLSFGHNLCFNYPNESCEPILDIYVSINF
jgi:hypothetical protein